MNNFTCAITGANGYIGSRLVKHFQSQDIKVFEMTRQLSGKMKKENHLYFSLSSHNKLPDLSQVDVLIHCAYDLKVRNKKANTKINLQGSINLLQHAKVCGVKKTIFISSMSAFENTRSMYGQTKLAIEKIVTELGGIIVRPGLVYGDKTAGLVGIMNQFINRFKFVPLIGLGKQVFYLCNINNLAELIFYLSSMPVEIFNPIIAAAKQPITFKEVVQWLAESKNKKVYFIPIPFGLLLVGLKVSEFFGLDFGLRSDSLIGAKYYDLNPNFEEQLKIPVRFESISDKGKYYF